MAHAINYTVLKISGICHGKLILGNGNDEIKHLLFDSRKLQEPATSLFFAIKSERNDGHKYLLELYQKGIRNFIVSDENLIDLNLYKDATIVLVASALHALHELAIFHRKMFNVPVLAITGSNGKTIVKEWLYQLLSSDKNIVRSPKSYNSQLGVPLSVWQLNDDHQLAIFEAGISKIDEMEQLKPIIEPSIGLITNIGQAHDEFFKDRHQKVIEKLKLFKSCKTIIYCKDYSEIELGIQQFTAENKVQYISWSRFDNTASLFIKQIDKSKNASIITASYEGEPISITIPFTDEASIENAIQCWLFLLVIGYDDREISKRMLLLVPVAMRLELKEGINNCTIINDSYNSDLVSLGIALDFLNQQSQHLQKTLVLSDIYQTGLTEEELYIRVAKLVDEKKLDRLIAIGTSISKFQLLFKTKAVFFSSTESFLEAYNSLYFSNESILFKGSRQYKFEQLIRLVQKRSHTTVMEVNLNSLINNLNFYRSKVSNNTKVMAMVKAFSYGSGSFEIANVLQYHKVDYLAVAYVDEGVELRKAGIHLPIMVMSSEDEGFDNMIKNQLEPEIFNFRILDKFIETLRKESFITLPYPIHIKLDTGMHRLGFEQKDISLLLEKLNHNSKFVYIKSVFSHLVGADSSEHNEFTNKQISLFTKVNEEIEECINYPYLKHILNSAGISRYTESQFDMVRLGIGLYGIGVDEEEQKQLETVSSLKTIISQIKHIPKGESIGYSRKSYAETDLVTATIPIGYADGFNRRLSNGKGSVLINGKHAPIIGNICMDMCMVNITGIDASEGDEVVIFGEGAPITDMANKLETITYEILTGISRRVKRVYFHE